MLDCTEPLAQGALPRTTSTAMQLLNNTRTLPEGRLLHRTEASPWRSRVLYSARRGYPHETHAVEDRELLL